MPNAPQKPHKILLNSHYKKFFSFIHKFIIQLNFTTENITKLDPIPHHNFCDKGQKTTSGYLPTFLKGCFI
jgi:hypothetical protein